MNGCPWCADPNQESALIHELCVTHAAEFFGLTVAEIEAMDRGE